MPDSTPSHRSGGAALIHTHDVHKTYYVGDIAVPAVRGVSIDVPRHQFLAIMGPSGSGKSTFMHLLGCLDRPDRGLYMLDGVDIAGLSKRELAALRNRKIGFVFQSFNLLSRTTVLDNVALPLTYQGVSRRERRRLAAEMLDRVGLADRSHHHTNQLSGGQQQRVAVARALVTRPVLLLADEPTGNLDSRTSVEIMALMQELNRDTGLTIAVVTHEMDIAAHAQRVVTFRDGVIHGDVVMQEVRDAIAENRAMAASRA
ncbi:Macrolide export ATP-binding/permease protein MacB [Phycisphaerae bacterium RAS2]|nr:Macrolide export ATP-binding/permease protein MacB [Phycisphaerae bacterium RAS2]